MQATLLTDMVQSRSPPTNVGYWQNIVGREQIVEFTNQYIGKYIGRHRRESQTPNHYQWTLIVSSWHD